MAGVLACGKGAVLSHRSAAEHWGMLRPAGGLVHVTVPTAGGRARRDGLRIHRSTLLTSQTTSRANIPITRPARTLLDVRRTEPSDVFRTALRQAEYDRLPLDRLDLGQDGTYSELEAMMLRLCRHHRLPVPEVNQPVGPYTVDFLWRAELLVVEVDSWRAHRGRVAYAEDRERDVYLKLRGYEVLRFTFERVRDEPAVVAGAIREMLARRRAA